MAIGRERDDTLAQVAALEDERDGTVGRLREEIDELHQAFADAADEAEQQRDLLRATEARLVAAEGRAERAEAALAGRARGPTADAAPTAPLSPEPIAQPHVPTFLHPPEGGRRGRRGEAETTEVQDGAGEDRGGAAAGPAGEAPAAAEAAGAPTREADDAAARGGDDAAAAGDDALTREADDAPALDGDEAAAAAAMTLRRSTAMTLQRAAAMTL